MHRRILLLAAVMAASSMDTTFAQPPRPQPPRPQAPGVAPKHHPSRAELQEWSNKLVDEISRLQDDLYHERDRASRNVHELAERALSSAVHFNQVLERGGDERHLVRDFQDLDQRVHALLKELNSMQPSWLRRAASRISYADQQLHYHLHSTGGPHEGPGFRERVARHARVLESEARQLAQAAKWSAGRDRGDHLVEDLDDFANATSEFRRSVERKERENFRGEFSRIDERWHKIVRDLNRSKLGLYVRRNAAQVNEVHNQLHDLILAGQPHSHEGRPDRDRPKPPTRPTIEFEIPGFGRFQLRTR